MVCARGPIGRLLLVPGWKLGYSAPRNVARETRGGNRDICDLDFWMLTGQTVEKRLVGMRVVRGDGQRLHLGNAIRRELAYVLLGFLFLGYIRILFDDRLQGWHDKLDGTIVSYSRPEGALRGALVRE